MVVLVHPEILGISHGQGVAMDVVWVVLMFSPVSKPKP